MKQKEIRKEWIRHGINCMTVWMLTDFCYQTGRIEKRLSASMLWKWGAVAAIWVGIGVFLTTTYRKVGEPVEVRALIMQENTEQPTLVTTLEDGSIVYMGGGNLFAIS